MAREIAFTKIAKISQAQKYMLAAVFGASIAFGIAVAVIVHAINQITYNSNVIAEEEKSIVSYSDAIKEIGVCPKPSGTIYSEAELKKCNPDSVDASSVPGTLRSNILVNLAANPALNSVPKESNTSCINPLTNANYTYDELEEIYEKASTETELSAASELIQSCSALRIIPDALPAFQNEEALLASLNKIFILSGHEPESLSPTGEVAAADFGTNLNAMSLRLSIEADSSVTTNVISNIERSIREFNINRATIEWGGESGLILQANATAYFMTPSILTETTKSISGGK